MTERTPASGTYSSFEERSCDKASRCERASFSTRSRCSSPDTANNSTDDNASTYWRTMVSLGKDGKSWASSSIGGFAFITAGSSPFRLPANPDWRHRAADPPSDQRPVHGRATPVNPEEVLRRMLAMS